MKGILKTYNVGLGDCITFQIQDGVESFNILIDCGELTDAVRDVIRGDFTRRIDLLVVTHIDEDHIKGVCDLLDEMHDCLTIHHIWFNSIQCGSEMNPRRLSEAERHTIEKLKDCFVANCQSTSGQSSLNDAKLLTEKILSKADWAVAWNNRILTSAHEDICYESGRWGNFKILSPEPEYLILHSKDFENMFKAYLYKTDVVNLEGCQFLYELLCRLSMRLEPQDMNEGEPSSSIVLSEQSVRDFASDDNYKTIGLTNANQMSIAFAWELNGKKILFLGDSHPNKVAKSIEDRYGSVPVIFDAIKVAHHGSEHNISRPLLKAVDSPLFLITGGEESSKPSYKSIARIICKPLPYREDGSLYFDSRQILCNRNNDVVEDYTHAQTALSSMLNYTIACNNQNSVYEFEI